MEGHRQCKNITDGVPENCIRFTDTIICRLETDYKYLADELGEPHTKYKHVFNKDDQGKRLWDDNIMLEGGRIVKKPHIMSEHDKDLARQMWNDSILNADDNIKRNEGFVARK